MIQLRYLGVPETTTVEPRLQYRVLEGYMDASGAYNVARAEWSEWADVPLVILPKITRGPTQVAPTDAASGDA